MKRTPFAGGLRNREGSTHPRAMAITRPGPRKTWKMVDLEHAEAVARGSVLVGTANSFSTLENGRADDLDGAVTTHIGHAGADQDTAAAARRFGLGGDVPAVYIYNSDFTERSRPAWIYCMSKPGCRHDWNPARPKAIFEIADVVQMSILIMQRLDPLGAMISSVAVAEVSYEPRRLEGAKAAATAEAHPFIKDTYFQPEQEVRILYTPRDEAMVRKPLKIGADYAIADLLTRVN